MRKSARLLVLDDLAFELHEHPIFVPIPESIRTTAQMNKFVITTYTEFMKLKCFKWYHKSEDIVVNDYMVRNNYIYPWIST